VNYIELLCKYLLFIAVTQRYIL